MRLFDFIIPLLVGSPLQGARREVQTPPLCEFRLADYVRLNNQLLVSPPDFTGERVFLDFG